MLCLFRCLILVSTSNMYVRTFVGVVALAASVLAVPAPAATTNTATATNPSTTLTATATAKSFGLNNAAQATGKLWFGTAFDYPGTGEATDEYYLREFNNEHDFGEATPANIMKVYFLFQCCP